jgi:hypothetical protein
MRELGHEIRVFKTKPFARFASQEGIADDQLREDASRVVQGLVDADLGGGVIKQLIARKGNGTIAELQGED